MHTLEMAMTAAALTRSDPVRAADLSDDAEHGIRSLGRLALAFVAIAAFCATMEVASRGFGLPPDAAHAAIERLD